MLLQRSDTSCCQRHMEDQVGVPCRARNLNRGWRCSTLGIMVAITLTVTLEGSFADTPKTGSYAIATSSGEYLVAVGGGGRRSDAIHSDAKKVGPWETFKIEDVGNGWQAIRASNGNYLVFVGGGGQTKDVVHTDAKKVGPWEKVQFVDLGDGWYAIRTSSGKYVVAVGGGGKINDVIHTDATKIGPWEKFQLVSPQAGSPPPPVKLGSSQSGGGAPPSVSAVPPGFSGLPGRSSGANKPSQDSSQQTTTCEGAGTACTVHPPECRGRGERWTVSGKIECKNGKAICVAKLGTDYCNKCGGECGGCYGQSCSTGSLCVPGSTCENYHATLNSDQRWQCRPIGRGCTPINNLCWTKDEIGKAQLGCVEGLR